MDDFIDSVFGGILEYDFPSVTPEMVDEFIVSMETDTVGDRTTIVRAVLRNGFEIVESSTCVCAENRDEALGEAICIGKIQDRVWELLGFLLHTVLTVRSAQEGQKG